MIPIAEELSDIIKPSQLREDEYLGEDGLIYCSKCRTARQKRIAVEGKTIEPRCMCACQTAAYEQREQERKHREFLDRVEKNRSVGLTDPVLRKHTFENDLGHNPKQMDMAKRFVQHWEEFKKDSMGLLLWGCSSRVKNATLRSERNDQSGQREIANSPVSEFLV